MEWTKEQLEALSTERLYNLYQTARQSCFGPFEGDGSQDPEMRRLFSIRDRIKAVLDTRDHIPRKKKKKKRPEGKRQRGRGRK